MTPYIDMHCDTLMQAWLHGKRDFFDMKKSMVNVERLQQGGCQAQFFAIFMPPITLKRYMGPFFPRDERYIEKLYAIFCNTARLHSDRFAQATTLAELDANAAAGKVSGILTLEDGRAVDGKPENLDRFYGMGIRLISLTWNQANCFGSPNSGDPAVMAQGLTGFGRQAVERMNELGMLVDVSHLSDGGFWDVANCCKGPFVASHSNCRSLNPHARSMTDEMLRTLAEHGGVAGVNFGPHFLGTKTEAKQSRIEDILRQLRHMLRVGGLDCAALGTDFDGIKGELEIGTADAMPLLFRRMEQDGFTSEEIEHIATKNVRRVLREVLR